MLVTVSASAFRYFVNTGLAFVSADDPEESGSIQAALGVLRLWPADEATAAAFADIFRELRAEGRMLSQFDLLIAALARQHGLILLTADQDFQPVKGLPIDNWL